MKTARIKLDYNKSGLWISGLLLISFIAFWPTYYAVLSDSGFFVHFHAATAIIWFALLIIQPALIRKRKLKLHRLLGNMSYPVAGLVLISILLLAHNKISTAPESFYAIRTYLLYLQISLAFVFAVTYAFAILYRKTKPVHARLMVATSFTFIDPVFARLINSYLPDIAISGQFITFGLINMTLIALSIIDRNHSKARWVFPGLLILYLVIEIPIFFDLTGLPWWQSFAAWFASI
ncbi:hypothetical protein [Rhodohalobacter mucosus]|uniref:Uncharacterized protein n=1 Tax=Rhodohalobacter mucosus TaxID=2079485 RepID=A0A316TT93_9BACT|nr:hypothetical protein [Rhodohalobacter mucosus]PWN05504.1 hypothetical protein DDZ15_12920 [Rhodohalobacter mucosus]